MVPSPSREGLLAVPVQDPGWKGTVLGHHSRALCQAGTTWEEVQAGEKGRCGQIAHHGLPCLSLPSTTMLFPQGC